MTLFLIICFYLFISIHLSILYILLIIDIFVVELIYSITRRLSVCCSSDVQPPHCKRLVVFVYPNIVDMDIFILVCLHASPMFNFILSLLRFHTTYKFMNIFFFSFSKILTYDKINFLIFYYIFLFTALFPNTIIHFIFALETTIF